MKGYRFFVFGFLMLHASALIADERPEYDLWLRPGQTVSDDPRRLPWPEPDLSEAAVQVIEGATLIDGSGGPPVRDAVVVIRGNRIEQVGRRGDVEVPADATSIDGSGRYLLPGLIDLHTHVTYPEQVVSFYTDTDSAATIRAIEKVRMYVDHGITSLRDVASRNDVPFRLKEAIRAGIIVGPRIFPSGKLITGTGGHGAESDALIVTGMVIEADGPDAFAKAVREQIKAGADYIKLASHYTREEVAAAIEAAHQLGIRVTADTTTHFLKWAVQAGIDCVEHPLPRDDETIELMAKKGTYAVPTVVAYKRYIFDQRGGYHNSLSRRFYFDHEANVEMVRRLKKAGVKIGVGTDLFLGYREHFEKPTAYVDELRYFIEAGFTPMEAIVAATRTGAEILNMSDKLGTLESGKLADLIMLEGNPLDDIGALEEPVFVMVDGKIID